jgi:hypothetical protein
LSKYSPFYVAYLAEVIAISPAKHAADQQKAAWDKETERLFEANASVKIVL